MVVHCVLDDPIAVGAGKQGFAGDENGDDVFANGDEEPFSRSQPDLTLEPLVSRRRGTSPGSTVASHLTVGRLAASGPS